MTAEDVWMQAYCAALTGFCAAAPDRKRAEVDLESGIAASFATDRWRKNFGDADPPALCPGSNQAAGGIPLPGDEPPGLLLSEDRTAAQRVADGDACPCAVGHHGEPVPQTADCDCRCHDLPAKEETP